ncbi:MAG: hypothetical protein JW969_07600 [Spirochaetales bacterium]|nr:hypothetical protein [Spirochaetales bacterium]
MNSNYEGFNEPGSLDTENREFTTLLFLDEYSKKNKKAVIPFLEFIIFVKKYVEAHGQDNPGIKLFAQNTKAELITELKILESEGKCQLEFYNTEITTVLYPKYCHDMVNNAYKTLESDIQRPFPTEENIGIKIHPNFFTPVSIKKDFIFTLHDNPGKTRLYKLLFPDNIQSFLITSNLIKQDLIKYCLFKVRLYLNKPRNSGFIENKLFSVFRTQDFSLREMINNIRVKPSQIIQDLMEPTDFTFRFWTHFSNAVIDEYKKKSEMLPEEYNYCQAAFLLGYFSIHYKGVVQKEKDRLTALKNLENNFNRPPYIFTLKNIMEFKDDKGFVISQKLTHETINKFLENKTLPPVSGGLPEIFIIRTRDRMEYYLGKRMAAAFILKNLDAISAEIRNAYIDEWESALRNFKKPKPMIHELAFIQDVHDRFKTTYPLIDSLLNYNLIYLLCEESRKNTSACNELKKMIDYRNKDLFPLIQILNLDKKEIYNQARYRLPFWATLPVISQIIIFLKKMFMGFGKTSAGSKSENKSNAAKILLSEENEQKILLDRDAEYKRAVVDLENYFVGQEASIDEKLQYLAERWNPLFEEQAKAHLVEDVNSMIRDYLRSMRRTFRIRPPDIPRIESLSETFTDNRAFVKIKKKEYFKHYVQVYILKMLKARIL